MSARAVAYVYDCSPYVGAHFALHIALADVANDAHNNELWMSVPTMAKKARLSDRHVRRALARMVADGYLELLEREEGKTVKYRFLTPGHGVTPDKRSPVTGRPVTPDNGCRRTPDTTSSNPKEGKNTKNGPGHMRAAQPPDIDEVLDRTPGEGLTEKARAELAAARKGLRP